MKDLDDLIGNAIPREDAEYRQPFSPEETANIVRVTHRWASDCFWTFEHLGDRMTLAKAGNAGRWGLWQMAKNDPERFLNQILPKAMSILDRAIDKSGDGEDIIVKAERKNIAELQDILRRAVAEATGGS